MREIAVGRKRFVVMVIAGAFVLASSAWAKTISHSGQVVGDLNSSVMLDVKKKKKKLKKVKEFRFEDVTADCQGKNPDIEVEGEIPTMKVVSKKEFSANIKGPDADVKVDGKLKKKGKKSVGTLTYSQGKGQERCRTGRVDFRTEKV